MHPLLVTLAIGRSIACLFTQLPSTANQQLSRNKSNAYCAYANARYILSPGADWEGLSLYSYLNKNNAAVITRATGCLVQMYQQSKKTNVKLRKKKQGRPKVPML